MIFVSRTFIGLAVFDDDVLVAEQLQHVLLNDLDLLQIVPSQLKVVVVQKVKQVGGRSL